MLVVDWCPKGRSRKRNTGGCYNWFFVHFLVGKSCLRNGKIRIFIHNLRQWQKSFYFCGFCKQTEFKNAPFINNFAHSLLIYQQRGVFQGQQWLKQWSSWIFIYKQKRPIFSLVLLNVTYLSISILYCM